MADSSKVKPWSFPKRISSALARIIHHCSGELSRLSSRETWVKTAFVWLGLSTLGWLIALAAEMMLRDVSQSFGGSAILLPAVSLVLSVWFGASVGACHATARWLDRRGLHRWRWICAALGILAIWPAVELSSVLVQGPWISAQRYVRAVRWALLTVFVCGFVTLWLWHAWGTSTTLRSRVYSKLPRCASRIEGVFWLTGLAGLPLLYLLFGGLLRPYALLAERLLFPSWLLATTVAFRLGRVRRRLALCLSTLTLAGSALALVILWLSPRYCTAIQADVLGAGGWAGLTLQRVRIGASSRSDRFNFRSAASETCKEPRALKSLALGTDQRRNVILLSIDSMRGDAIGKRYGKRAVAPNLEAFARESIYFERAVAPAPITLYSIGSLLTGRSVSQLLWLSDIPENLFASTRALFDRQYIVTSKWEVFRRKRLTSLIRQRTPTDYVPRELDPTLPLRDALTKAREKKQKIFFWLHLVDAHAPYRKHAEFDFGESKGDRYYSEIAYDDNLIGSVLLRLREKGYFDDSLIVIFSDHGESLGEDGHFGHGVSVVARYTDVPLFVYYPGVRPRVSKAAVSLSDIAPTVLHFLQQAIPESVQ